MNVGLIFWCSARSRDNTVSFVCRLYALLQHVSVSNRKRTWSAFPHFTDEMPNQLREELQLNEEQEIPMSF